MKHSIPIAMSTAAIVFGTLAYLAAAQQPATRPSGEMVVNGDFENDMTGWSFISEGDARGSIALVTEDPLNAQTPHSLRLEAPQLGKRCGVANSGGASGMTVRSGEWLDATFCARIDGARGIGLLFSLETEDGKTVCARTTLPEIGRGGEIGQPIEGGNEWRQYTVSLHAYGSNSHCRLVISPIEPGTLYLDRISLVPRTAKDGSGRTDQ